MTSSSFTTSKFRHTYTTCVWILMSLSFFHYTLLVMFGKPCNMYIYCKRNISTEYCPGTEIEMETLFHEAEINISRKQAFLFTRHFINVNDLFFHVIVMRAIWIHLNNRRRGSVSVLYWVETAQCVKKYFGFKLLFHTIPCKRIIVLLS